ncbi:MAG: hypothetical protein ABI690_07065 [Chloroflexota bacterium]
MILPRAICFVLAGFILMIYSTIALAHIFGGGAIIQYGLAAPDDRVIYVGSDVSHSLRLTRNDLLPARLFSTTNTAPDGRQVMTVQSGGNFDLFLTELDGTQRQLTHFTDFLVTGGERASRRANQYPSWSPDGTWIAYISSNVSGRLDLYAVHPDGSAMHHLGDRIRVGAPYTPRWVTFDSELPTLWLLVSVANITFLIWLFRGYGGS